ncbi:hypothetical protein PoB_001196700 [Plakobranchus ocellatus]|uniref:Uncharacterized protein n=1 Tax=Plakobranchus ocellatus TaxID=259542 RepID=A0AAV3YTK1_9GAST|nr:hypothetical protein PoB_001196700 [Plakobranchus ocellatus]
MAVPRPSGRKNPAQANHFRRSLRRFKACIVRPARRMYLEPCLFRLCKPDCPGSPGQETEIPIKIVNTRLRPAPSRSTIHAFMDPGNRARHGRFTYGRVRVHYARSLGDRFKFIENDNTRQELKSVDPIMAAILLTHLMLNRSK